MGLARELLVPQDDNVNVFKSWSTIKSVPILHQSHVMRISGGLMVSCKGGLPVFLTNTPGRKQVESENAMPSQLVPSWCSVCLLPSHILESLQPCDNLVNDPVAKIYVGLVCDHMIYVRYLRMYVYIYI